MSTRVRVPSGALSHWRNLLQKEVKTIKQINQKAYQTLIANGVVNPSNLRGITITSKGKKSRGKRYYAKNKLAFMAWEMLGENPDDPDFQKWKSYKETKGKHKQKGLDPYSHQKET